MIFLALKKTFSNIRYAILAMGIALAVFVFSILLPNLALVWKVGASSAATMSDKINIFVGLLGSIQTNFTSLSASYLVIISALFGTNVAMLAFHIKQKGRTKKSGVSISVAGLASGMFGIGCAACGSFILGTALPLVGAGGALAFLPFGGEEFGIVGVGILGASLFLISKKIQGLNMCLEPTSK